MMKSQPIPLIFMKALSPGERWITVHPNGNDAKGTPILIRENTDGSASVIGGAGGKLNYLRLHGVKSEADYKKNLADRQKAKREKDAEQRKRDKELGIYESKKAVKDSIKIQQMEHERNFIHKVADAMDWDKSQLSIPEDSLAGLSDEARIKATNKYHRDLMAKANQAVDIQRQNLLTDAEARAEADIGSVPLVSAESSELSVDDLAPVKEPSSIGLGFSADYKNRAMESGLTDDDLKKEVSAARESSLAGMSDAQRKASIERGNTAKLVRQELEGLRTPEPPPVKIADAKKAIELLKAEKELKAIQKKAKAMSAEVRKSEAAPKAYILEVSGDGSSDMDIMEDLNNDLRTAKTRAFLSEIGKTSDNPHDALGKHVGVGAYNSINSLALAVGGNSMMDRSVVDVVGIAGAAQIMARRLHNDLEPGEMESVTQGMEDFHLHHYMEATEDALREAREHHAIAKEIELGEAVNGDDLMQAQEMNAKRRDAIRHAERLLGTTLGEMEANAALVMAMKQPAKTSMQVPMGKLPPESIIQQARAIGLQRGEYSIDRAGADQVLTINSSGMDRLARGVDRESVKQINRNVAIIRGDHDEENWLPLGFSNRPDLDLKPEAGVAQRLAVPFEPGDDLHQSLRDYIGGRAADGDSPVDILADLQSSDFQKKVGEGRGSEYMAALNAVAPLKGDNGRMRRVEDLEPEFHKMADDFVGRHYGGKLAPIHKQSFDVDQKSADALHRALAEEPAGVAAFKAIGDLKSRDQKAIRDYFAKNIAKESPEAAGIQAKIDAMKANMPERKTTDMFGDITENPEWSAWKQEKDKLGEEYRAKTLAWADYVQSMRGNKRAYESVQDLIKSKVNEGFARHYNALNADKPLKIGRTVIRNNLAHLDTVDPAARQARQEKERALIDSLMERVQGRYAPGSVIEKLNRSREEQAAFEQSQMGFFSSEDTPVTDKPLGADERHTIGHQAERQVASMMSVVGKNFKAGQPLKIWQPTMSGKGAARQRAIKYLDANKRMVLAFGVGSGKSAIMLGGMTHLKEQGKVNRGLFLVPSIVQGQFSGEALRYLQPGKYNWHIEPGASRDERIKAYKNPEHDFAVMTHQSFRDDMIHLGAKHAGINETEMAGKLGSMPEQERRAWMKSVMEKEGINFDYLAVDEGHNMLNRSGKENSTMANVVDALSYHSPYYVSASGDPVKNDTSEFHDLMKKMDPDRYADRATFMRKYGVDTDASRDALRREMGRYVFPSKIDPDVHVDRKTVNVPLSDGQSKAMQDLDKHLSMARIARMSGGVDVDAVKAISPSSFDGVPDDQHEKVARELQSSLGIMKSAAIHRILNESKDSAKFDYLVAAARESHGKPGVVFARSLGAVKEISDRLRKEGFRVSAITGADSAKVKERKRQQFQPDGNSAPEADILVVSDAGATGMNVQRGQWLWQHDTPDTAMIHAQRQGRINRIGQINRIELLDAIADHPEERKARDRLSKKYALRELLTSPLENLDDTGLAYFLKQRQSAANNE